MAMTAATAGSMRVLDLSFTKRRFKELSRTATAPSIADRSTGLRKNATSPVYISRSAVSMLTGMARPVLPAAHEALRVRLDQQVFGPRVLVVPSGQAHIIPAHLAKQFV